MKTSYQFSGHTDYARRFGDATHVGDTETGKAVWAWRDGLWTVSQHSGASTFYVAQRVSVNDIATPHDTRPARQALQNLVRTLTERGEQMDNGKPISVTIRREPEPLYRSGWKFVAYRDVEVQHPNGKGNGVAVELFPLYLAAETVEELMQRVSASENVQGFFLPGTCA